MLFILKLKLSLILHKKLVWWKFTLKSLEVDHDVEEFYSYS